LEDQDLNGRITLKKGFSQTEMGRHGLDCTGSGHGQMVGACDSCNKASGCTQRGQVVD
jgi:hypothetical protein